MVIPTYADMHGMSQFGPNSDIENATKPRPPGCAGGGGISEKNWIVDVA